ncbi:MAG TPA: hypothetical protein VIE63_05815 [Ramlibacter sp.]|jgi:hypothetical protein
MRTLVYGLLLALGLGAVVAPVIAGLLGVMGLASAPAVRLWLFGVPESILGVADVGQPGLAQLVIGWTIEFFPLGLLIAVVGRFVAGRQAAARAVAFDQAVTAFHESEYEAEYE